MAIRPSATGNYARAGKAVADDAAYSFDAARTYSPKADEMVRKAAKLRAEENLAARKIEKNLRSKGIAEYTKTKNLKTDIDAKENYKAASRKAGLLATAGGFLGKGIGGLGGSDRKRREVGANDDYYSKRIGDLRSSADTIRNTPLPNSSSTAPTATSTSSPAPTSSSNTGTATTGGGDLSMQYMKKLTSNGMSDVQAAATVGHLLVETGGFKHMEELAPNVHGTKGYGHLQWTDPSPGRGRRTDFMNYTQSRNLDPQSFEANSDFLVHEMTTNFNQSWTGGGSFEGLQQQGTLEGASAYLQNNFIRPSKQYAHTDRRLAEGRSVLEAWRNQQS